MLCLLVGGLTALFGVTAMTPSALEVRSLGMATSDLGNENFQQPDLRMLLLLRGNVEMNPGPPIEREEMEELLEKWSAIIQQRVFTDVQELIKSEVSRIDTKIDGVQASLDGLTEDVKKLREKTKVIESDVIGLREAQKDLDESYGKLEEMMEETERKSRRNNVIVYGVKESPGETHKECQVKFLQSLNDAIPDLNLQEVDIGDVHRLGRAPNRDRPILAQLLRTNVKIKILKSRNLLKDKEMNVACDLTINQRTKLRELKENGMRGYYRGGYLIIADQESQGEQHNDMPVVSQPVTEPVNVATPSASTYSAVTTRSRQGTRGRGSRRGRR